MDLATLESYIGKNIKDICPVGFWDNSKNHCAHFVCHLLAYNFTSTTCATVADQPTGAGTPATIRVQEVFPQCISVGSWDTLPSPLAWCLIFMTNPSAVDLASKTMQNVDKKHVGFFWQATQMVYHYSNKNKQVAKQTLADFSTHYAPPDNGMFWGIGP
jgi:hypothetical protein